LFINQQLLLCGKSGFDAEQTKIIKKNGALVFYTILACETSASVPVGHKNEFPLSKKKWKKGDSNQISMLIHGRGKHQAEFDGIKFNQLTSHSFSGQGSFYSV
jgi:hypothetical protein